MSKIRKKVIVVGAGFAGVQFVRKIDTRYFEVILIDKLNHHQFQPLFYQVATSQIEPSSISFPLRHIFNRKQGVQIRLAEAKEVRESEKILHTDIGNFTYDYLVIAVGCKTNFFGNKQIEANAFTLKSTYEAIQIRNHILLAFEKLITARPEEKEALSNLVIVGAGPTGVELAGAFSEIKREVLPRDFPGADFSSFRIILVEGSQHTLNNLSIASKKESEQYLLKMGVELFTGKIVESYNGDELSLKSGEKIRTKTVIWAAGVTGNTISGLHDEVWKPGNRIEVDEFNRVKNHDGVFALGDIAYMSCNDYPKAHPQVANVAINQAKLLAKNLKKLQKGEQLQPFHYRDLGSMATIGRNKAVVDFPFAHFKGYFAWLIWMFLHLMLILSVRNKLIIFINWAWAYLTKDTALRLILSERKTTEKYPETKD